MTAPDPNAQSPARGEHPPCPETVEGRVDYIISLMADLLWERGKTAKVLAEAWGLSKSTIENYSAEAHRQVVADEDDARRDITAGCRKLFKDAVNKMDHKGAKAVGELWASVSGAKAPEKREHKVTGFSLDDIDELKKATGFDECPPTESEPSS